MLRITQSLQGDIPLTLPDLADTTSAQRSEINPSSPPQSSTSAIETDENTDSASPTPSPSTTPAPSTSRSSTGRAITTTDQFGNLVVLSGASDGAVITTTDARGRTITTTYNPRASAVSSTELLTSTLPNGEQQTLTSVAIVTPSSTNDDDNGAEASTTSGGDASLVTGNAAPETRRLSKEIVAFAAGAAGVAWLL